MKLLSTSSINNVDIQAILNEINDDDDNDDEFLLHHQDSMADISSLSIGGVTNSFHFAPAQISAAVNSAVVVEHQQRLPYAKGTRITPIKGNKRREIDIEQILRESDECDNMEDAVTAMLNQQLPNFQHNGHFLDEDDGSTIESCSLTVSKFLGSTKIQPNYAAYRSRADARLPQQGNHEASTPSDGDDDTTESWVTNSATTSTTSDEDTDYLSKSTISTKAGLAAELYRTSAYKTNNNTQKPSTKANSSFRRNTSDIMADARDWAVLQSILAENDDDDDDDLIPQNFTMQIKNKSMKMTVSRIIDENKEGGKNPTTYHQKQNINFNVDTILQDEDEDIIDVDIGDGPYVPTCSSKPITAASPLSDKSSTPQQPPQPLTTASDSRTTSFSDKPHHVTMPTKNAQMVACNAVTNAETGTSSQFYSTTAAMMQAQLYENRLLHGHHQHHHHANNTSGTFSLVSPLSVKRRMKPKIELWTKSRQKYSQRQDHSTLGRYEFSGGAVNVASLSQISNHMTRTSALALHNLPTALAVSSKFICIGTQSGSIYIYDMFQEKRQVLEPSDSSSVTSIDINGEMLIISGYSTGTIILWDAFTGKPLRTCTDLHASNSPITLVRFLPNSLEFANSSNSKEDEGLHHYAAVSVDASGLVNKLTFTKSLVGNLLLWGGIAGGYSVEVECLLDGSAGQILALEVLPSLSQIEKEWRDVYEKNKHFMRRVTLVGLSSIKSSFVVAVEPTICVLHRWSRQQPTPAIGDQSLHNDSSSSTLLPCLTWGWALVSGGGNVVHPILARSWGQTLQLLRANYINPVNAPSDGGTNASTFDRDTQQWPAFGVLSEDEFSADSAIVSLHWINERSLAYLTANCEFTVIDTVCMTFIDRFDFSQHKIVYAELKLSSSSYKKSNNATFSNSIRSCIADQRLYVTCQHSLIQISLQSTKSIILDKEANGEWLQALALALDYYENYVQVLEDRLRQQDWDARGRDMRWHPELMRSGRMADSDEWITMLLLRYLKLAVENAPVSHSISRWQAEGLSSAATGRVDLTLSHYTMLAGICIEYCIGTRRLNVLYQQVYPIFLQSGYDSVFFNVLEPYALKDALKYMSPEVMAAFVENCKRSGDFEIVERCLLHLDVTIMDFNSILPILKSNELYSALVHVFTLGLDDYVTPLEILIESIMDAFEEITPELRHASRRIDGFSQNKFDKYGYKALLYLTHCLQGKTFPWGSKIEPIERLQTLRPQVLKFLLQPWYKPSAEAKRCSRSSMTSSSQSLGKRADPYPYLSTLILVDAKAVFDVFSIVFDSKDVLYEESRFSISAECDWRLDATQPPPQVLQEEDLDSPLKSKTNLCPDRQSMVSIIAALIRPTERRELEDISGMDPDLEAKNSFLDFIAKYLERGIIRAPKSLTHAVLTRMSQAAPKLSQERNLAQERITCLMQALPADAYDLEKILQVMENERMKKVSLLLHKVGAENCFMLQREGATFGIEAWDKSFAHFVRAVKCYITDTGTDAHPKEEIFEYVKSYYSRLLRLIERLRTGNKISTAFQKALLAVIPKLVMLDAGRSAQLVAESFIDDLGIIIDRLRQERGGEVLFNFLRAIISGQLSLLDPISGPLLLANLNTDQHHLYLTLMAKFHPEMVYQYLITQENPRIDDSLKLCLEHKIPDATAYMMELSGKIPSALELLLKTLESRIVALKRVIRSMPTLQASCILKPEIKKEAAEDEFPPHRIAVQRVKDILTVALDLCERNSGVNSMERDETHGHHFWFDVLDNLIKAKRFFRHTKEAPHHNELFSCVLGDLLQMTMQRLMSNVPLSDLLHNFTTENSESRLGEFREILMSMLKAYSSELMICSCAVDVMHVDKRRMSTQKHQLKLRGTEVHSMMSNTLERKMDLKSIPFLSSSGFFKVDSNGDATQDFFTATVSIPDLPVKGARFFSDASLRLRLLRQKKKHRLRNLHVGGRLSCLTSTEHKFYSDTEDLSDALNIGNKQVGMLTDAEHFGSINI